MLGLDDGLYSGEQLGMVLYIFKKFRHPSTNSKHHRRSVTPQSTKSIAHVQLQVLTKFKNSLYNSLSSAIRKLTPATEFLGRRSVYDTENIAYLPSSTERIQGKSLFHCGSIPVRLLFDLRFAIFFFTCWRTR